jgi:hypothetical protein
MESFEFMEALSSFVEFFAITLSFRVIFFFGFFCVRFAITTSFFYCRAICAFRFKEPYFSVETLSSLDKDSKIEF